jgi:hypothetical protein
MKFLFFKNNNWDEIRISFKKSLFHEYLNNKQRLTNIYKIRKLINDLNIRIIFLVVINDIYHQIFDYL